MRAQRLERAALTLLAGRFALFLSLSYQILVPRDTEHLWLMKLLFHVELLMETRGGSVQMECFCGRLPVLGGLGPY